MASADCPRTTPRGARAGLAALMLAGVVGCGDAASDAPPQASMPPRRSHLGSITELSYRTPLFAPPSPAMPHVEIAALSTPPATAAAEPQLVPLPLLKDPTTSAIETTLTFDLTPSPRELPAELPVAAGICDPEMLLPLQPLEGEENPAAVVDPAADAVDNAREAPASQPITEAAAATAAESAESAAVAPAVQEAPTESAPPAAAPKDEKVSLTASAVDTAPSATGLPTGAMVNERAQAEIRRGYALAQRGANFAARSEFVDALRMIAEAKDQIHGAPRRTIALAEGLRALEEAADFLPRAAEADADLGVDVIVAAHRTPVGKTPEAAGLMPQKLAALYFRYAQVQLGAAVAGEPAGSMALHGLGKLYSQLGRVEPAKHPQAERRAFALQQAALVARGDNHLAAHELGVLLAEAGHLPEAEHVFSQVVAREPHPVVLRNLARVQRKLGREQMAAACERRALLLAERSAGAEPVMWVTPETLARTGDSLAPAMPIAQTPSPPHPQPAPSQTSTIQNARRLPPGYQR